MRLQLTLRKRKTGQVKIGTGEMGYTCGVPSTAVTNAFPNDKSILAHRSKLEPCAILSSSFDNSPWYKGLEIFIVSLEKCKYRFLDQAYFHVQPKLWVSLSRSLRQALILGLPVITLAIVIGIK